MKNIKDIILTQLEDRLSNHVGLSIFAEEKAKFEGWLKKGIHKCLNSDAITDPGDDCDFCSYRDAVEEVLG